tara:strand:- start:1198 stop:1350 length:153 start_codon:yes stop_codon:yes gene_type:complete
VIIKKEYRNLLKIDEKTLRIIQEKLNNILRKIIGFKTPKEMIDSELKKVA